MDIVTEYLALGLRFGRLVDGFADYWIGDPALARRVADEPPPEPAALARRAGELLAAVPDSGLSAPRAAFLAGQMRALECSGYRLAGEKIGFVDEVRAYFDAPVTPTDPAVYAQAHEELNELLPGRGSLRDRLIAFRDGERLDPERLGHAARAVSDALRDRVRAWCPLPAGEHIDYDVVGDRPWNAFNSYLGDFRSHVALNADAGHRMTSVAFVASHEGYPGHHLERCVKEAGLVADGQAEHTIALVNTPQCLLAEGTAELALAAAVGPGWGAWLAAVLADCGLNLDGPLAERVETAAGRLLAARQDAALLLHDRGADTDEVVAYLARWMLVREERARHMVRFLTDPLWRAYTTTYIEGARLVRAWLAARPAEEPIVERYGRLLAEPLSPAALRAELGG